MIRKTTFPFSLSAHGIVGALLVLGFGLAYRMHRRRRIIRSTNSISIR